MKRTLYDAETNEPYKDSSYVEVDKSLDVKELLLPENCENGTENWTTTYNLASFIVHYGEHKTEQGEILA